MEIRCAPNNIRRANQAFSYESNKASLETLAGAGFRLAGSEDSIISFTKGDLTYISHYPIVGERLGKLEIYEFDSCKSNEEKITRGDSPRDILDPEDFVSFIMLRPSMKYFVIYTVGTSRQVRRKEFEENGFIHKIGNIFPLDHQIYKKMVDAYRLTVSPCQGTR